VVELISEDEAHTNAEPWFWLLLKLELMACHFVYF
jgi:hypothetical protein